LDYMEQTWEVTPRWHKMTVEKFTSMFPAWEYKGADCLSWIWVDTKSSKIAEEAVRLAKAAGVPLRWGGLGYKKPDFFRCAVRSPHKQVALFKALEPLMKMTSK